jgi:CheY-like chemotaxis protein
VFKQALPVVRNRDGSRARTCGVLLVEGDKQLREIGRIMLEYLGYAATVAADGGAAVQALREGLERGAARITIAIVDLPGDDAEALGICRLLHGLDSDLKIIASSASILDPAMEDCRKYGCVNTLPKPYSMDSLNHVLAALQS